MKIEELFKKNFPQYCTEKKRECLSPFYDVFEVGVEIATAELNKGIIQSLTKENAELKVQIEKMKAQHFSDIRLYTKVIGIAVEESVMNDKQNYKNYLFDKAKKILSMGVKDEI